jgi:uncharacterized NAD-dependent epimerase/dehydratase family protein
MISVYEDMASTVRPARIACVALNCRRLDATASRRAIEEVEDATGLVTGDVFRGDAPRLWEAIAAALVERRVVSSP